MRFNLRIDGATLKKLRAVSFATGVSRAQIIRVALAKHLASYNNVGEKIKKLLTSGENSEASE